MRVHDSNIIIGAAGTGREGLLQLIEAGPVAVSTATLVEVLGYHKLKDDDRTNFEQFFGQVTIFPIDDAVILRAIVLRQARKMSLGDALIAATALVHDLPLVTRNTADFARVEGLAVIDPDAPSVVVEPTEPPPGEGSGEGVGSS